MIRARPVARKPQTAGDFGGKFRRAAVEEDDAQGPAHRTETFTVTRAARQKGSTGRPPTSTDAADSQQTIRPPARPHRCCRRAHIKLPRKDPRDAPLDGSFTFASGAEYPRDDQPLQARPRAPQEVEKLHASRKRASSFRGLHHLGHDGSDLGRRKIISCKILDESKISP